MNNDIVYFEINDWWAGETFPDKEPFIDWCWEIRSYLLNTSWCKENKIISIGYWEDMSISVIVAAPIDWVKENCPSLLDEDRRFILTEEEIEDGPHMKYKEHMIGAYFFSELDEGHWELERI